MNVFSIEKDFCYLGFLSLTWYLNLKHTFIVWLLWIYSGLAQASDGSWGKFDFAPTHSHKEINIYNIG